ncbi:MAG: hypothetical protein HDT14_00630, partial [Oscillibacter sp.]|nr:hypothetical protein [Oscillibacter sp.]
MKKPFYRPVFHYVREYVMNVEQGVENHVMRLENKKETKKMNTAPAELLKEYVKSQQFTSTAEIMTAMKEMFRDVVQTAMEVELDEELGRERCQSAEASEATPNYRNGYSRETVKTQLGEVDIKVPRDRKGSFEPKIISKYSRNADGMEEKIL